jgi:hypothetical protein
VKPRFLADADFNQKVIAGLKRREPSLDFLSAKDGGTIGRSDPEVLEISANFGRVLVSHDRRTMLSHYVRFRESQESPGLIVVSQDLDVGETIEQLLLIWTASDAAEWWNQVIFVPI